MQGVTCRWFDEEETIIYQEFGTRWDWNQINEHIDKITEMLRSASGEVDFIADFHRTLIMPSTMLIENAQRLCQLVDQEPRYGITVAVGMTGFTKGFWQLFSNLYDRDATKLRLYVANSIDEAHELILARRAILDHAG